MINMQDLVDMVCTEAYEGNNGDTCQDFGHVIFDECTTMSLWVWRHFGLRLSLKRRAREQRRLDRSSNVRRRKRRKELQGRKRV